MLFLSGLLLLVDARTVARSLRPPFDLTRCCFVAADPERGVSAVSSGCGPGVSSRFMRMCCGLPCNHVPRSLGKANLVAVDEDDVAVLYDDDDDDDDDALPTAPYVVPFAVPFAVRCARRRRRRRALPGRRAWAWSRALLRACSVAHILFSASSACVVDEPRPEDMKLKVFVDCHGWAAMWLMPDCRTAGQTNFGFTSSGSGRDRPSRFETPGKKPISNGIFELSQSEGSDLRPL